MTALSPPSALPFLPLTRPNIDEATIQAVAQVIRSGWITSGPKTQEFETVLSEFFGHRPVRCFANGTATLEAGLRIAGIQAGDEVITTPISWVATANVILAVGAMPVFVDVDPITYHLDLEAVRQAITPRTKAILPVHLAGLPVDMDALYTLAKQYKLRVIEDAAQAIGAQWQNQRIGSIGDIVSFSFQANKNITCAEGGCLVLNNAEEVTLAEKLRLQGVVRSGFDGMEVDVLGGKDNLSDIHATIGLGQFPHLHSFQQQRQRVADSYLDSFAQSPLIDMGLQLPSNHTMRTDGRYGNWHLFQVLLPLNTVRKTRAEIMQALKEQGIGSGVHYPAIHLFKLYQDKGFSKGMYPIAEHIAAHTLSLPLFSAMHDNEAQRVVKALEFILTQK